MGDLPGQPASPVVAVTGYDVVLKLLRIEPSVVEVAPLGRLAERIGQAVHAPVFVVGEGGGGVGAAADGEAQVVDRQRLATAVGISLRLFIVHFFQPLYKLEAVNDKRGFRIWLVYPSSNFISSIT